MSRRRRQMCIRDRVRRVRIGYAFAVGRYEITNAQYRRFVEASGHAPSGEGCQVPIPGGRGLTSLPGTSWADPGYGRPIRDDEPVACLRWSWLLYTFPSPRDRTRTRMPSSP